LEQVSLGEKFEWTLHGRSIAIVINRLVGELKDSQCMKIVRDITQFEFDVMRPCQTATAEYEKDIYVTSLTDMLSKMDLTVDLHKKRLITNYKNRKFL
jgi:hypothetical protein